MSRSFVSAHPVSTNAPRLPHSPPSWLQRLSRTVPGFFRRGTNMASAADKLGKATSSSHEPLSAAKQAEENKNRVDPNEVKEQLSAWGGYFKKDMKSRHALLCSKNGRLDTKMLSTGGLDVSMADVMVENCVGIMGLPVGVAPTFVINGKHYVVPMCVEEPSVIAAAAGIGKLVASAGGFHAVSTDNIMTGQVQLLDLEDAHRAISVIKNKEKELVDLANTFCVSMKKRGGGVLSIDPRLVQPRYQRKVMAAPYVIVHIQINVCESMGANLVNTVAEGLAPHLEELTGGRAGLKILTNLCAERRTVSTFHIPLEQLEWKGVAGSQVAERILEAFYLAEDDSFRATTNNKGIMNGMDAVALATGQDWRAIEAAAHAYALRRTPDGETYYGPLAQYYIEDTPTGQVLTGRMELPISVGTVGGALQTHPLYKLTHKLLGKPDSATLAQIIVSVGLAQNFAAIRAMGIEGIQRGHMALHARNVAVAAGVPPELVAEVTSHMVENNAINKDVAAKYLASRSLVPSGAAGVGPAPSQSNL